MGISVVFPAVKTQIHIHKKKTKLGAGNMHRVHVKDGNFMENFLLLSFRGLSEILPCHKKS